MIAVSQLHCDGAWPQIENAAEGIDSAELGVWGLLITLLSLLRRGERQIILESGADHAVASCFASAALSRDLSS